VVSLLYTSSSPPLSELRARLSAALALASPKSPDRPAIVAAQVRREDGSGFDFDLIGFDLIWI
jgi:hypothetical protein